MDEASDPDTLLYAVIGPLLPDVDRAVLDACIEIVEADPRIYDQWTINEVDTTRHLMRPERDFSFDSYSEIARSERVSELRRAALEHPGISPSFRALALARHCRLVGDVSAMRTWYRQAADMFMAIPDTKRALAAYTECAAELDDVYEKAEMLEHRSMVFTHSDLRARSLAWNDVVQLLQSIESDNTEHLERLARAMFYVYWPAMNEDDRAMIEQAATYSSSDIGWAWRARALLATLDDDIEAAIVCDERAITIARKNRDIELEWLTLRNYVSNRSSRGDDIDFSIVREVGQQAEIASNHAVAVESYMTHLAAIADSSCYQDCAQPARELLGYVNRRHLQPWNRLVTAVFAWIQVMCGQIDIAQSAVSSTDLPENEHGLLPDLGFLDIVRAFVALESGASTEDIEVLLEQATQRGAGSFELYEGLVMLAQLMMDADDHGVASVLERISDISSTDMACVAQTAIWLARTGVFQLSNESIAAALDMVERDLVWDPTNPTSYASLSAREIQLIGRTVLGKDDDSSRADRPPDLDDFERMTARWKRAGYHLDAARCELVALSLHAASRLSGSIPAAILARRAIAVSDRLRGLGVTRDQHVIERLLSGDSARLKELMETSLARCRILEHTDPEARQAFLSAGMPMEAAVGKVLFERGEVPEALYVIASGGVRLVTTDSEGRELTLDALGVGDVFGSIRGDTSQADAFAETTDTCVLLVISRAQVESLRRSFDSITQGLDREADLQRARIRTLAIELAYASAHQRLARLILSLDSRFGHPTLHGDRIVNRRITQNELASMIGTSRKSVSAILGDLRQQDALDLDRKRIVIRDYSVLRKLAEGDE